MKTQKLLKLLWKRKRTSDTRFIVENDSSQNIGTQPSVEKQIRKHEFCQKSGTQPSVEKHLRQHEFSGTQPSVEKDLRPDEFCDKIART